MGKNTQNKPKKQIKYISFDEKDRLYNKIY